VPLTGSTTMVRYCIEVCQSSFFEIDITPLE
jgi:hypothetical protein